MIGQILHRVLRGLWMSQMPRDRSLATPVGTRLPAYRWVCECGARSRGGNFNRYDVECLAQRHWLNQGQPHPQPVVEEYLGTWGRE